jgi:hypothetical protein
VILQRKGFSLRYEKASDMATKHFKHWAESELGDGIVLMEAMGDEIVRQVEIYGSTFVWCDQSGQSDQRFMLADQPLSSLGLGAENEITAAEFEDAWNKAKAASSCL